MKQIKCCKQLLVAALLLVCMLVGMVPASAASYYYTSPFVPDKIYYLATDPADVALGIDISYHQGNVDWKAVADSGVEFVFLRAAVRYAGSGLLAEDTKFKQNIEGALANGIRVGLYVYSQAITVEEVQEEADFLVKLAEGYDVDLPLVYDPEFYENAAGEFAGRFYTAYSELEATEQRAFLTSLCTAFADRIRQAGYFPLYYGSYYWLRDKVDISAYSTPAWMARYATSPGTAVSYSFWQYTDSGNVPGILKADGSYQNVDCNFCFDRALLNCRSLPGYNISFSPTNYPQGIISPGSFNLKGTVSSTDVKLKSVTGTISTVDGTVVQSVTAGNLNTTTFSIQSSIINNNLKFGSLADGTYTLTYTATDANGNSNSWTSNSFVVFSGSATESTITISPEAYPTGKLAAGPFSLTGTITGTAPLATVTATLTRHNSTNTATVQTASASNINSTSFSIKNSSVDVGMRFSTLNPGTYSLTYTVTDLLGNSQTWTSPTFTIVSDPADADPSDNDTPTPIDPDPDPVEPAAISITPTRYPSGTFTGSGFTLRGTITSGSTLTKIEGQIVTVEGTVVQSAQVTTPGGTSFSIQSSTIDNGLRFGSLSAGYYRVKYLVTDSSGNTAEWTSPVFAAGGRAHFADVTNTNLWYYNTVYTMASRGIFSGYQEGATLYFRPDRPISRVEVVATLYQLAGSPAVSGTHPFTDATADWYQTALTWAYQNGVVSGTDSVTFSPDQAITREAFAQILFNYYGASAGEHAIASYTDADAVSAWALDAVNWCVAKGIISSTSTKVLQISPLAQTTRATAAQLLYNASRALGTDFVGQQSLLSIELQDELPPDNEEETTPEAAQEEPDEAIPADETAELSADSAAPAVPEDNGIVHIEDEATAPIDPNDLTVSDSNDTDGLVP